MSRYWPRRWLPVAIALLLALVVAVARFAASPHASALHMLALDQQPVQLAVDEEAGRTYLAIGDTIGFGPRGSNAHLVVIDNRSAAIVARLGVIDQPAVLTLDSPAHRVLLSNDLGGVSVIDTVGPRSAGTIGSRLGSAAGMLFTLVADPETNRAFRTNQGGGLDVLDAKTGLLVRTVLGGRGADMQQTESATVDAATHRVFVVVVTAAGQEVAVLDANTGTPLRTIPLSAPSTQSFYDCQDPVVGASGDRIYVPDSAGGRLLVLDGRSGSILRALKAGTQPCTLLLADSLHRAYLTDTIKDSVVTIDTVTDRVLWTARLPARPGCNLFVDQRRGVVLVLLNSATGQSALAVLSAASGRLLRTVDLGGVAVSAAFDEPSGHLYIARVDGSLLTYDGVSPRPLRTISVGMPIWYLAVDGPHRRLIGAGSSSHVPRRVNDDLLTWLRDRLPWLSGVGPASTPNQDMNLVWTSKAVVIDIDDESASWQAADHAAGLPFTRQPAQSVGRRLIEHTVPHNLPGSN